MFTTVCPGCEASLNAPDTLKGKKVKCKKCGEPFVAKPRGADDEEEPPRKTVKMKSVPPPKSRNDDEDDETDEAPSLIGKKSSKRPADDEDTEVMEAARDDEDDEPRPKKKKKGAGKGKSKKKEGSPALLIILIAIGALVVLGGGAVGAYFLFIKEEDKPTNDTQTKGGTTGTAPSPKGATPGIPTTDGATAGWVEVVNSDTRVRLLFPSQPKSDQKADETPWGQLNHTYYEWLGPGEFFLCGLVKLPQDKMGKSEQQLLDEYFQGAQKKLIGQANAEVKDFKEFKYGSAPALEFYFDEFSAKGQIRFFVRMVVANDHLIMLMSMGVKESTHRPRSKGFFDSLKIS